MSKNNHIHNSFIGGEASKKFAGRTDTAQYNQTCEDIENFIVYPQGGAGRRPGTHFVYDLTSLVPAGDTLFAARLFPFVAADGRRYQIAFMAIEDTSGAAPDDMYLLISAINVANHEITTVYNTVGGTGLFAETYHDTFWDDVADQYGSFDQIQFAQSGNTMVFAHPNLLPSVLIYDPAPQTGLAEDFYYMSFFNSSISGIFGTTTEKWERIPFTPIIGNNDNVAALTVNFIAGTDYDIDSSLDFFGAAGTIDGKSMLMKFSDAAQTLVLGLDANTSETHADATFLDGTLAVDPTTFGPTANPDASYEISQWGGTAGFPRTVAFFEGRLVFGGNKAYPDTFWMSQIGDIFNFRTRRLEQDPDFSDPVVATDPFYDALRADIVGTIQWISPGKTLTVGTNFREFTLYGPNSQEAIGPTNYQSSAETPHGSAYTIAGRVENTTVFIQRDRRTIRELVYNLDENSFQAANLNIIGEHISKKAEEVLDIGFDNVYFKQMAVQQVPIPIVWVLDTAGTLCGLTRERTQQVAAWHHHTLAGEGYVGADAYTPTIEDISIAKVPGEVEYDELWMIVTRGVGPVNTGEKKWYVERLGREWERKRLDDYASLNTSNADERLERMPVYMDCTKIYDEFDQPGSTELINLPHGNGAVVDVVVNGFYLGQYTVASNKIDIGDKVGAIDDPSPGDNSDWIAMVGFNYEANLVPVPAEVPAQLGTSLGSPRRTQEITLHLVNSLGIKFGRKTSENEDNTPTNGLETIPMVDMSYVAPVYGFTGDKVLDFPPAYESRPQMKIQSYLPFPAFITHIINKMVVYE